MTIAEALEHLELEFEGLEVNERIQECDPHDNMTKSARLGRAGAFGECRAIVVDMMKEEEYARANREPES